jgi:hypothetical protein
VSRMSWRRWFGQFARWIDACSDAAERAIRGARYGPALFFILLGSAGAVAGLLVPYLYESLPGGVILLVVGIRAGIRARVRDRRVARVEQKDRDLMSKA